MPVNFLADRCVLWLNDTPYSKSVWRCEYRTALLWTLRYSAI